MRALKSKTKKTQSN